MMMWQRKKTETVVGIDLGTTNSSIAILRDGRPEVLRDGDDGLVPSCVGLGARNEIVVGSVARNQAALYPERTVLSVKRQMGSTAKLSLGDREYSPQEVSAFILRNLVERAKKVLGSKVERVVITVPAYFTDAQRKATREAGELAGLSVDRIVNEPTAASLAYDIGHKDASQILVYDLGGGTFDVSVVRTEGGVVEVLATAGDNRLGGDDFDALIVERLNERLEKEGGSDLRNDRSVQARLLHAAEAAKRKLSFEPFATVEEDNLAGASGRPVHLSCELSRVDFERDIKDLLQGSLKHVSKALADAKLRPTDLDLVLLVGGSTRIPMVARLLKDRLGSMPHGEVDPDQCVALGAAVQAAMEAGLDVETVLVDITPYTFGVRALGQENGLPQPNLFVPIIPRNSKLPITKSEAFATLTPEQKAVQIDIYQGESSDTRDNTKIGSFLFDGLNKNRNAYDDGIIFQYTLNADGILELTAKERVTGTEMTAQVDDVLGAEESAWDVPGTVGVGEGEDDFAADSDVKNVRALLKQAKTALKKAPTEDLKEIERLSRDLRKASKRGDQARTDELADELAELLFFVDD